MIVGLQSLDQSTYYCLNLKIYSNYFVAMKLKSKIIILIFSNSSSKHDEDNLNSVRWK